MPSTTPQTLPLHLLLLLPLLLPLILPPTHALDFTQTYATGPLPLPPSATLSFTHDPSNARLTLGLRVTDADTLRNATAGWLGLGLSEPTSGSMLGADIVTAEFLPNGSCVLTDRHVPFAPFPLLAPPRAVFPLPDACPGDWTLLSCARDDAEMVLEVVRPLAARDLQDRAVGGGVQRVVHAYGAAAFGYHNSRRGGNGVAFFDGEGAGADGTPQMIAGTGFAVPEGPRGVRVCTGVKVDVGGAGGARSVVAAEAALGAGGEFVEGMTLHVACDAEFAREFERTRGCVGTGTRCGGVAYAWGRGSGRYEFPEDVGVVLEEGGAGSWVVLEVVYANANRVSGVIDASGVVVFLREGAVGKPAGTLAIGDSGRVREIAGERVENGTEYSYTCPKECTRRFGEVVTLFGAFASLGRTGRSVFTNKFGEDGVFVEQVHSINFWSNTFHTTSTLPNIPLSANEALSTTCSYDTTKLPRTTFGPPPNGADCTVYLLYYPVQTIPGTSTPIGACRVAPRESTRSMTSCGNGVLDVRNPAFGDPVGARADGFGAMVDTCRAEEATDEEEGPPVDGGFVPSDVMPEGVDGGEEGDGDGNACFPGDALVTLADGRAERMSRLRIGDTVKTGKESSSKILLFTHRSARTRHKFVELATTCDKTTVRATRGHYIATKEGVVTMREMKVDMWVRCGSGGWGRVTGRRDVWGWGLFNPQTGDGEVVVDGVVFLAYTESVGVCAGHALLAPVRAFWRGVAWGFGGVAARVGARVGV